MTFCLSQRNAFRIVIPCRRPVFVCGYATSKLLRAFDLRSLTRIPAVQADRERSFPGISDFIASNVTTIRPRSRARILGRFGNLLRKIEEASTLSVSMVDCNPQRRRREITDVTKISRRDRVKQTVSSHRFCFLLFARHIVLQPCDSCARAIQIQKNRPGTKRKTRSLMGMSGAPCS